MLISWKYNFLFVHIPKTGGTALTRALIPYARFEDRLAYGGVAPFVPPIAAALFGPRGYIERVTGVGAHAGVTQIEDAFGRDAVAPLVKAAFVRNPFTLAFSLYAHIQRTANHPLRRHFAGRSFYDCIPDLCEMNWTKQTPKLLRRGADQFAVDFIGAFERLDADAAALAVRLNLPRPLGLERVNANQAPPDDLRKEYGDRLEAFVVANRAEFEMLGYSTNIARASEPPTRRAPTGPAPSAATSSVQHGI